MRTVEAMSRWSGLKKAFKQNVKFAVCCARGGERGEGVSVEKQIWPTQIYAPYVYDLKTSPMNTYTRCTTVGEVVGEMVGEVKRDG